MSKNNFSFLLIAAAIGFASAGCAKLDSQKVHQDISSSLDANAAAVSIDDWEMSDFNPEVIFKKWKDDKLSSDAICGELGKQTGQQLTLFENEINEADNAEILAPCKDALLKTLEDYWTEERKKIPSADFRPLNANVGTTAGSVVKFPDNVQYRDVSNGYFAFKGDVAKKEVVLTFDDGPHEQYTDMILSALRSVNAKVIFFAMGKNVKSYPQVLHRQAAAGHMIGSHSVDHKCLGLSAACNAHNMRDYGSTLNYAQSIAEITGGHQAVYDTLGWVAPFFRFPYGEDSPEVKQYLKDHGVAEFAWSIDSNDWREGSTPQQVVDNTLQQLDNLGRGIILFHDIQRKTAELMPYFLKELYFKGYSIVLLKPANSNDIYNSKIVTLRDKATLK